MTQDLQIILKGLHCCSRTNPFCEECPYVQTEVHCRELESDAADAIKSLVERVTLLETSNDQLGRDIDVKLNHITDLETTIEEIKNKITEGDIAEVSRIIDSCCENIKHYE